MNREAIPPSDHSHLLQASFAMQIGLHTNLRSH